jgi:hypothetical protein
MMGDTEGIPSNSTLLRWAMLLVVAANMAFIAVYSGPGKFPTLAEVAAVYGNTFVPFGFVKAICVPMLVAFLSFYLVALWPGNRRRRIYDALVVPHALTSVMASIWIVAFRNEAIGLAAAAVAASVVLGGVMLVRVARASPSRYSLWLRVPFSLYFGTMTMALLISLTQWLNASGVLAQTALVPDDVATAFLAIAAAMGGYVALRYGDFVYPAVITSGAGAMFIAQRTYDPNIAADALAVGVVMLIVAGLAAIALAHQPRRDPKARASHRRQRHARGMQDEWGHPLEANTSVMRI